MLTVEKVEDDAVEVNKRDHAHVWVNELEELLLTWIGTLLGCSGRNRGKGQHGGRVGGEAEDRS